MSTFLLCVALVAGVVVLTPLADRFRVPLPVLLTIYGLALPLLPFTPELRIEPDLILPVVLPPLLFAATTRSTANEFRQNARPILVLAVGLTVASAAAVALLAHAAGLGWGPAFALGAIVAPPDPVAATAVARRLRLPDRLVTVLEGEGMFNDATALVLYSLAVSAVVSGQVTGAQIGFRLVLAVVVGIVLGLVAGVVTKAALGALHDSSTETTVTVAMPFVAYLAAERLDGSGVLAVLTLGLFLRSYGHPALTSGGWLLGRAVWGFADYVITSLVFVLIGFELTAVLQSSPVAGRTVALAAGVVLVLVAGRFGWMFAAVALARWWQRRRSSGAPFSSGETVVVSWAGMRGVVTVATALALPLATADGRPFPERGAIVVIALTVVLVTLVAQGLTLTPLVRRLGVGADTDVLAEVAALRRRAAQAALDSIREHTAGPEVADPVRHAATLQYQGYLDAQEALTRARTQGDAEDLTAQLADVLRRASDVERDLVLAARRRGDVSAAAADEVLQDIEARAVREAT